MAIVEVIGSLIRELATSEDMTNDSNQTYKQLDGLFELLISRTLDLSSYVRSKVLTTLSKMLEVPVRFAKQRLRITRAAVDMLEDKASTVRKTAVSILVKLILTHPYGEMYGGDLNLQKWEERYKAAKAKLQEMEGVVGKAVEKDEDEEEEDEEEEEEEEEDANAEEEDEADGPKKTSKKCATLPN
jgi:condensin complex subunit 1